jgi:hypothetical protein
MAFPQTPRAVKVDLYLNNGWVDVTNDAYVRDSIVIHRGAADENTAPQPSTCTLTLNNRSGNYSPRNPTGIYYGSIGRNTPIRVAIEQAKDTFTRTVSNGWSTADTGQAWSTTGAGGTVAASDFAVNGTAGTHSVPAAAANRVTYLPATTYRDIDVSVQVSLPFSTVTGAAVEPANIVLRGQSTTTYYYANVSIATSGAISVGVLGNDGTVIVAAVSTGLTFSGQALMVRAQTEGPVFRVKVWNASTVEPYVWNLTGRLDSTVMKGWVGIRSGVVTGNTNTKPIVFTYDNLSVRQPRFTGEASSWPQRWDLSGNDVWAPVEAGGLRRRMGQSGGSGSGGSPGAAPVKSSMRRFWTQTAPNVVAYWPMEDGKDSLLIASGLAGGSPMTVNTTATKGQTFDFASYSDLPSSSPLPTLGKAWLAGNVPAYTSTNTRIIWFMHAPATALPDVTVISQIFFSGTLLAMQITFRNADGSISLEGFNRQGTSTGVLSTGPISFQLVDTSQLCLLDMTQNGANIDWAFTTLFYGDSVGAQATGTITGFNFGQVSLVSFDPYIECKDTSIGHVIVKSSTAAVTNTIASFNAWSGDPITVGGETMGQRVDRLATENNLTIGGIGSRSNTKLAGPQRVDTLLNLLDMMANSDFGILSEMKGDFGLAFRTRASMYNQTAALDLNYSTGQVSPPLEPTDDDQQTRNDVTLTRDGGANAEAQLLTGRMSLLSPDQGGVGIYTAQVTVSVAYDSQLPSAATWLVATGTVNETRYPVITTEVANPNVTSLDAAILDVDLGDRITISNPKTGQTPDQITQIVRGYTETIDPYTHTIGFNCSPESPYEVVRLGSGYKVDSTTSTLASGVTSSATTLSVANAGSLWATSGVFPIQIRVAGEVMNVTAISGTSSPQTFTVTRSVNGVVKTQVTGAVVSLAKPSPLAL